MAAPVDLATAESTAYRMGAYPDWDDDRLHEIAAWEERRSDGGVSGLVALSVSRDSWISLLYYSESGIGYRMLDELAVPLRHNTTATYPLPPGDDGLSRLVVWKARPKASTLEIIALTPLQPGRSLPGLVAEQWFVRSRPQAPRQWLDQRLLFQPLPLQFFLSREPYAVALLSTSDLVEARNCTVTFRGMTVMDSDIWGTFGQWQIGVGSPLQLSVPLRSGAGVRRAELRIQGQLGLSGRGQSGIELDVNGWRTTEVPLHAGVGQLEQLSFDVSHDLEPGLNALTLRTSVSGSNWLLRSVELWVE